MWKKVEVGEEGICIRDEEKRDDKVGLGSQEIVTAQYTMLHVPWMYGCMDVLDGYDTVRIWAGYAYV